VKYIDPLGDSSIIKDLTNNIVKEVELKIDEIFEKGGMKTLIERGEIQSEIEKSAFEFQEDIDSKKTIFIGVNKFINENEIIDSGTSFKDSNGDRLQRLNIFKEKRDNKM
jgi:Methylmalonyl-CoA mutase, N-terminal domain/subunit